MSTGPAEPARAPRRVVPLTLLLALGLAPLAGCSDDPPPSSGYSAEDDAAQEIGRALRLRERAVLAQDQTTFLRTVVAGDEFLVADQTTYFENLQELPVGLLRYRLDPATLEPEGADGAYWGEVETRLRLEGYDAAPVRSRDRYLFTPTPNRRGFRIASTTDPAWERTHLAGSQSWELGPVQVREGAGVLGIFDEVTADDAYVVLTAVEAARDAVVDVVPVDDAPGVLVYATSDPSFVEGLAATGDPDRLDAITFPMPVDLSDPGGRVASYRVVLGDDALVEDEGALDRLLRHELTHIALGDRGRGAPLWLTEGLAEYVSVRPMAAGERRLPPSALSLVADGVTDLPADGVFLGQDAQAWYAVAWWVCESVAAEYGVATLWELLDELAHGADQTKVLDRVLGLTPAQLARRGADLMVSTYGS